jgi:hypothetical protein
VKQRSTTKVRLTRKYADLIDGIDLSRVEVGDVMNLAADEARILIAEGWATPADFEEKVTDVPQPQDRAEAADRPRRKRST